MTDNIITYAQKYKDTDFSQMPFSEVDALILCQTAYYDFGEEEQETAEFRHPVSAYMKKERETLLHALVTRNGDDELVEILETGGRHGDLKVANFIDKIDESCDQQFSAITYELPEGEYFIAFRGTDNSVVGWKEDFNMSFQDEIPSQKEAVKYAADMMKRHEGRFYLGGHSKGGNLAVYTAMMLPDEMKDRLICVYNYDGPGFWEEVYQTEAYQKVRPLIRKMIPQGSIVGMILEGDNNYAVVKNKVTGFMQHNAFNWIVKEDSFEILEDADASANLLKGTLHRWLKEMDIEERKQFVDSVFDIIYSLEITTLNEVSVNRKEKTRKLLKHLSKVEPEETKLIFSVLGRFVQASAREMRKNGKRNPKLKTFRLE